MLRGLLRSEFVGSCFVEFVIEFLHFLYKAGILKMERCYAAYVREKMVTQQIKIERVIMNRR